MPDVGEGFSEGSGAQLGQGFLQPVWRDGRHSGLEEDEETGMVGSAEIPAGTMTPPDSTA